VRRDGAAHHGLQLAEEVIGRSVVRFDVGHQSRTVFVRADHDAHVAHGGVTANRGFDAVELHPRTADLDLPVLAPDAIEQAVGPPSHQIAGSEDPHPAIAGAALPGIRHAASSPPSPERDVGAANQQFTRLAGSCRSAVLIDHRQGVARQRIADRNSRIVLGRTVPDEPLHHRRLGGGVHQLNQRAGRHPIAQQRNVAPQRRVAADSHQAQVIAGAGLTALDDGAQQRREAE